MQGRCRAPADGRTRPSAEGRSHHFGESLNPDGEDAKTVSAEMNPPHVPRVAVAKWTPRRVVTAEESDPLNVLDTPPGRGELKASA